MEHQDAIDVGEGSEDLSRLLQHHRRWTKMFTNFFHNMVLRSRMEQQNVVVGEGSENRSRLLKVSSAQRHTPGQSSEITARNAGASASTSTHCHSTRIHHMIQNRSNFTSEVEFDIAYSKDHHWSQLVDSDSDTEPTRVANAEYFRELKNHPEWGAFFMSVKVVVGKKINEGAQAEIYDAIVEFEDGYESPGYGYHVVKVMKGENPLQDFQRQWPVGMLCNAFNDRVKGPLMWILGGTMIRNRFAFIMPKQWGDLRKLIDEKMQFDGNRGPPRFEEAFLLKVLLCVARDMDALHTKHGIIHRDLKASNILLWSLEEGLPCDNPHVKANVADYECSVEVVGSGFWRAPEILQQMKDRVRSSKLVFTKAADVYSYGMVCYELLYGRIPFEEDLSQSFDVVLNGGRPQALPEGDLLICNQQEARDYFRELRLDQDGGRYYKWTTDPFPSLDSLPSVKSRLISVMQLCWNHEPSERPTFSEIVELLESVSLKTTRVQRVRIEDGRESSGYRYHVVKVVKGEDALQEFQRQQLVSMLRNASESRVERRWITWILGGTMTSDRFAFVMPKQWGNLRMLIFEKRPMSVNWGPPTFQENFLLEVMLCIARDMDILHTKHGVIHKDLKASNILLWSFGEGLPCDNPHVKANVFNYGYGRVGSNFRQGPEIHQQLKDRVSGSNLVFTKAADVYSYAMICYELLSGRTPFKGHQLKFWENHLDVVLSGGRPQALPEWEFLMCNQDEAREHFRNLQSDKDRGSWYYKWILDTFPSSESPSIVKVGLFSLMQICWDQDPSERPTFSEIVKFLESMKLRTQNRTGDENDRIFE